MFLRQLTIKGFKSFADPATLERLAGEGIEPERPPYTVREGGSLLCFVRDPDGYRVEIIERPGASD